MLVGHKMDRYGLMRRKQSRPKSTAQYGGRVDKGFNTGLSVLLSFLLFISSAGTITSLQVLGTVVPTSC